MPLPSVYDVALWLQLVPSVDNVCFLLTKFALCLPQLS